MVEVRRIALGAVRLRGLIALSWLAFVATACEAGSNAQAPGDAAVAEDAGPSELPAVDPSATRIDFVYTAEPPTTTVATVQYERDTRLATWHWADPHKGDVARTLTDDEVAQVDAQLHALTYLTHPECGGFDGLVVRMKVSGGSVADVPDYVDRWNNCGSGAPPPSIRVAPGVHGIYDLFESLAPPPGDAGADRPRVHTAQDASFGGVARGTP